MSTTNTLPTGSSTSYLVRSLQGLESDHEADAELRKQAKNCLSYLYPLRDGLSKRVRMGRKQELAGSSTNAEGLTATDSVHDRDTKLKLLKIAARIVSKATKEEDKKTMMNIYGFDCNNAAYRLGEPNGTLNNSAFAAPIPGQKDKYRLWERDSQGGVEEKTIGPEGLSDRLGVVVTLAEERRRAKSCEDAASSMQLDELTDYIVNQPEGTFVNHGDGETEDWTRECKSNAQEFRGIFKFDDPPLSRGLYSEAKKRLRSSNLNHPMMRETTIESNTKSGSFETMGLRQVGRILFADRSQHPTVEKLVPQRPDWEHAVLAGCAMTNEHDSDGAIRTKPDLANSHWFFPSKPKAHPRKQLYDHVTVVDGEIVDVTEVTAGWMQHALSQAAIMASAKSVDDDDGEEEEDPVTARGESSKGGSKRRRMEYGEIDSGGSE